MSAELQSLQSPVRAVRDSEPFYFDSGDHRLFGWLHRCAHAAPRDVGVVLCQPFGYEAICAHRGVRAFAEAIAAAGMPALRFDYLGTGDSPDIDPEADQLEVWTHDVLAAVEELKSRTGVLRVCLLGFRLGALLATRAAAESSAVSGLVVVSPIASGRRYLRELRMTRMAASLALDPEEELAEKQDTLAGGMEVSGFAFSAATLAALAKVEVTALQPSLPQMLVIEGAMSAAGATRTPHVQGLTTRVALPGLVEMLMTPPQFAQVPKEAIALTLDWLSTLAAEVPAAANQHAGQPVGAFNATDAAHQLSLTTGAPNPEPTRERPVFFGADGMLFGILTQPPASEIRRRAVVLLNAGADHHIGASRLYVSMARRWAQHGYVVLRMDLGGVGDSGTRPGRTDDDVFPQEALADIGEAIDFLRDRYGIRDVTLAGLCSGGYHALRAAVAGLPVNRILMVNPQNYFWRPGESLQGLQLAEVVHNPGVYRERVMSLAAWKRILTGKVNILRIVKIYLQRPILAAESKVRDVARRLSIRLPYDLGSELEEVVARGVRVVFVFARGEPGIELLKLQAGNSVKRLGERCRIHILNAGDHVFTRSGPRAVMEKLVSDELFARSEFLDKQSANLSTVGLKFE
jgi:alpha-beta hydrolase superfamily lysophospholipase